MNTSEIIETALLLTFRVVSATTLEEHAAAVRDLKSHWHQHTTTLSRLAHGLPLVGDAELRREGLDDIECVPVLTIDGEDSYIRIAHPLKLIADAEAMLTENVVVIAGDNGIDVDPVDDDDGCGPSERTGNSMTGRR